MKKVILTTAAVLALSACANSQIAYGPTDRCPDGRGTVAIIAGVGPWHEYSCDPVLLDRLEVLHKQDGREYRALSGGEAHDARAVAFNNIQPGLPAGSLPATGTFSK